MSRTSTRGDFDFNPSVGVLWIAIHLACLGVFVTGVEARDVVLCAGSFFLRMFGLTIGYHRYFAHRTFKTSRAMQLVLALLAILAMQRGPLWWAETHRAHHRHTDSPDDIHSPRHRGFLYAHCGWFMDRKHARTNLAKVGDLARFPELVWLDDWRVYLLPMGLFILGLYAFGGPRAVLWGFAVSTVLLFQITHWIQSFSHTLGGYRRCPTRDDSRNHLLVGLLTLGEWHNNHHYYPSSARQGYAWWELDIGYWILRALALVGLVWDVRVPPADVLATQPSLADEASPVHGEERP